MIHVMLKAATRRLRMTTIQVNRLSHCRYAIWLCSKRSRDRCRFVELIC